jgi:SAM-dependent methyltransferase
MHEAVLTATLPSRSPAASALLVCPACRGPLTRIPAQAECAACGAVYRGVDGSYDFAASGTARPDERQHYESKYETRRGATPARYDTAAWAKRWNDPHWPEGEVILRRIGDCRGRVILALGNGASVKELFLAERGATLLHSDLSLSGPLTAKHAFDLADRAERVAFHAMDAYRLPLPDLSVDVVYGFEFVHHLPDVGAFLDEARRVLKPGGSCIFFDHGYSPLWQGLKMSVLRPVMKAAHWLHGISPEDLRATYAGGYREAEMSALAAAHGFTGAWFERTTLFQYVLVNGVGKLVGWDRPMWSYRIAGRIGASLDRVLTGRVDALKRSRVEMVWGFARA